jgi:hypothetical protein
MILLALLDSRVRVVFCAPEFAGQHLPSPIENRITKVGFEKEASLHLYTLPSTACPSNSHFSTAYFPIHMISARQASHQHSLVNNRTSIEVS